MSTLEKILTEMNCWRVVPYSGRVDPEMWEDKINAKLIKKSNVLHKKYEDLLFVFLSENGTSKLINALLYPSDANGEDISASVGDVENNVEAEDFEDDAEDLPVTLVDIDESELLELGKQKNIKKKVKGPLPIQSVAFFKASDNMHEIRSGGVTDLRIDILGPQHAIVIKQEVHYETAAGLAKLRAVTGSFVPSFDSVYHNVDAGQLVFDCLQDKWILTSNVKVFGEDKVWERDFGQIRFHDCFGHKLPNRPCGAVRVCVHFAGNDSFALLENLEGLEATCAVKNIQQMPRQLPLIDEISAKVLEKETLSAKVVESLAEGGAKWKRFMAAIQDLRRNALLTYNLAPRASGWQHQGRSNMYCYTCGVSLRRDCCGRYCVYTNDAEGDCLVDASEELCRWYNLPLGTQVGKEPHLTCPNVKINKKVEARIRDSQTAFKDALRNSSERSTTAGPKTGATTVESTTDSSTITKSRLCSCCRLIKGASHAEVCRHTLGVCKHCWKQRARELAHDMTTDTFAANGDEDNSILLGGGLEDIVDLLEFDKEKVPAKAKMMHRFFRLLHAKYILDQNSVDYAIG
jgi:hypothetical protein